VPDAIFAHPRLAPVYDAFDGPRHDLPAYLGIADDLGAERVLDAGCGTGSLAILLADTGPDVIAADPAAASLDVAKSNTHEVAQAVAPDARIVYVDNDPIVLVHARALLTSTGEGATAYLDADLRDPSAILHAAAQTLDFGQPVALMLLIILHLIPDPDDPYGIVAALVSALPAGSYLVLAHPASDIREAQMAEMTRRVNERMRGPKATMRDRAAITRFFDGLELLAPGVVQPPQWRPEPGTLSPSQVTAWCGVARKR
jgi:SAM-dependent methyltransferase